MDFTGLEVWGQTLLSKKKKKKPGHFSVMKPLHIFPENPSG